MPKERKLLLVKILLTLAALEFFGPALRDANESHLTNATWPGHARLHMMWFIAYFIASGILNVYLIWFRRTPVLENLYLTFGWQTGNLIAFWAAAILAPLYGGAVIDGQYHTEIFGINENYVAFTALGLLIAGAFAYFHWMVVPAFRGKGD